MLDYLALAGIVFGANLLPAFGPPTWSILVFFRLQSDVTAIPLVMIGAVAAASGRLVLAFASRRLRHRLSARRLEHLAAARAAVSDGPKRSAVGLGLFALSPLPSAQLFIAAGLVAAPIVPLTIAFFAGRIVSYTIYVAAASAATHSLGSIVANSFTSPVGIALQVALLAALVALVRVDWAALLTHKGRGDAHDRDKDNATVTRARHRLPGRIPARKPKGRTSARAGGPPR